MSSTRCQRVGAGFSSWKTDYDRQTFGSVLMLSTTFIGSAVLGSYLQVLHAFGVVSLLSIYLATKAFLIPRWVLRRNNTGWERSLLTSSPSTGTKESAPRTSHGELYQNVSYRTCISPSDCTYSKENACPKDPNDFNPSSDFPCWICSR